MITFSIRGDFAEGLLDPSSGGGYGAEIEIAALCTLVESSTGRQDFETRWRRIHGQDQQELFNA